MNPSTKPPLYLCCTYGKQRYKLIVSRFEGRWGYQIELPNRPLGWTLSFPKQAWRAVCEAYWASYNAVEKVDAMPKPAPPKARSN